MTFNLSVEYLKSYFLILFFISRFLNVSNYKKSERGTKAERLWNDLKM